MLVLLSSRFEIQESIVTAGEALNGLQDEAETSHKKLDILQQHLKIIN